jgi:phospholipase A2
MKIKSIAMSSMIFTLVISQFAYNTEVDTSKQISAEEKDFFIKHKPTIDTAVKHFIDQEDLDTNNIPTIALCGSGGGTRAAICFSGFLLGAQNIGLFNASSYISTLSGSTWMMGPLLARQKTLPEFTEIFRNRVQKPFMRSLNYGIIAERLISTEKQYGHLMVVDLWGAILADRFMGDLKTDAQFVSFKNIRQTLTQNNNFQCPFPIFSTVIGNEVYPYPWLEVTPFTTGSSLIGGRIPTTTFGSEFYNGSSKKELPERSLGCFLGIFGSPYSLNLTDLLADLIQSINNDELRSIFEGIVNRFIDKEKRFLPSSVNNFLYSPSNNPLRKKKFITLTDAGMTYDNIATPPLLDPERHVDVIIVCDASTDAHKKGFPEIHAARQYAKDFGLNFPSIDNPEVIGDEEDVVIFKGTDKETPTIVYFPNKITDGTLKFEYSNDEFDALCNTMQHTVEQHAEEIANAIREKIEHVDRLITTAPRPWMTCCLQ